MTDMRPDRPEDTRISQGRSPAYPYVDLGKAIERADQIRGAGAPRQALPPEAMYKIWGIGPQSSGSRQTMAALNHFGLVEYIGRGDDRKVKLSDLALRIVLDKQLDSKDRQKAIREAALTPPIHAELFEKYGSFLPANVVMETYLTRDRGYNEQAANALIGEYQATLVYAGLDKPDNMPDTSESSQASEGSNSMQAAPATFNVETPQSTSSTSRNVSAPTNAEVWIRGPLSANTSYQIYVSGEMGPKEIGKLIKILEAQKAVLSDDDDDQA